MIVRIPRPLMNILRLPIPVLISLAIMVLAAYLILTRDQQLSATNFCPADTPATVEFYAHLKLPESIEDLWTDCVSPAREEGMIRLRFDMDANDFDSLLQSMTLDTTPTEPGDALQYIEIPSGNTAFAELSAFYYSLTENTEDSQNSTTQEMLIDRSNSERYTVYLVIVNHLPELEFGSQP